MRVHASVGLSSLFGPSVHDIAVLASMSCVTDMFAGSFKLPSCNAQCICACVRRICLVPGPFWLLMCSFESLAGKFGIADAFSGLFELSPTLCVCMRATCVPVWLSSLSITCRCECLAHLCACSTHPTNSQSHLAQLHCILPVFYTVKASSRCFFFSVDVSICTSCMKVYKII